MRVGKPNEMTVQSFPLLTARISEAELAKWFPVRFHSITHPQETAEPSKAALIRLDKGEYFVLYWGEWSRQPKLKIPSATDPSRFLDAFFREVPLQRRRIIWRRQDARLPSPNRGEAHLRPHVEISFIPIVGQVENQKDIARRLCT